MINATQAVVAWLVSIMLTAAPPARGRTYPEAAETREQGEERYREIAQAVVDVAYDPEEAPLFGGKKARALTALTVLSVAFYESGFRKDVDLGLGRHSRGDAGGSHCLMQRHIGRGKTAEGWDGADLVADRTKCLRAGLHHIRLSMHACRKLPLADRLSVYTSGRCMADEPGARARMQTAWTWGSRYAPPRADADVILSLANDPHGAAPVLYAVGSNDEPSAERDDPAVVERTDSR
jgi:hypothetical protein